MTESEFGEAFPDPISRPWPRSQNSRDQDLQPAAMTRVYPDFGTRPIGTSHGTRLSTHPRGGRRIPLVVDIQTRPEPVALDFSRTDIGPRAA
jgi:hypothetical protein